MILDERSLTIVLFKINNKSFDFSEHEAENRDLNDYLLIRSLFTKIILNDDYEKFSSYFSTRIKIMFMMYFIMSDVRLIIYLLLCLIVAFNFFRDERNDFEFKKSLLLKFKSKSF